MKWPSYAMENSYRLVLFHISHRLLLTTVGAWVLLPVSLPLTPVPGLSFPICSTERRLWDLQNSPNLDLAGTKLIYRASHGWSPFYDKTTAPREVAPTRGGCLLESERPRSTVLLRTFASDDGYTMLNKYVSFLPPARQLSQRWHWLWIPLMYGVILTH